MRIVGFFAGLFVLVASLSCGGNDERDFAPVDMLEAAGPDSMLPYLDPPLSEDETRTLHEGFAWETTEPLAELDEDGNPALHYVMVYVRDDEDLQLLDLLEVPNQTLPLFPEERARWAGQVGVLHNRGDGQGLFRFAIIPAQVYNALRDESLEAISEGTEPPFDAVIFRDAPVDDATHDAGTLRYDYLVDNGFRYGSTDPDRAGESPLIFELIALLTTSRDARDGVDDALSAVDRGVRGSAWIVTWIEAFNTDFDFGDGFSAPLGSEDREEDADRLRRLVRAWGPDAGDPLVLPGVEIVAQSALGTVREHTDRSGQVTLEVADGQSYDLCLRTENAAAGIGESFHSLQFCSMGLGMDDSVSATEDDPVVQPILVRDWRMNVLAQMTDVREYTFEVLGHPITRGARVLVGPLADTIGTINGGRAAALCGGFLNIGLLHLAGPLALVIDPISATQIVTHDIVFPHSGDATATHSRLVPSHEYSHFVMCDYMANQSYDDFAEAIADISYTVVFDGGQTPDKSNLVFLEAWADFMSAQVVGGLNYISLPGAANEGRFSGTAAGYFCEPTAEWCVEDNVGGPMQVADRRAVGRNSPNELAVLFRENVARMLTLMHDAFDGSTATPTTLPFQAGMYWRWNEGARMYDLVPGGSRNQEDEEVVLPPTAMRDIWTTWARHYSTIDERSFASSLARVVRDYGYDEAQTCELFALHSRGGECEYLLDEGAVDASELPPSPPTITRIVMGEENLSVGFVDYSPRATGFRWRLEGEDGSMMDGTLAYGRRQSLAVPGLTADTRYTLYLTTLNGDLESTETFRDVVTLAEPVTSVSATPGRGRVSMTWAPVRATSWVVERQVTDEPAVIVAEPREPRAEIIGLEAAPQGFFVYSVNQEGVRSEPSPLVVATPFEPSVLYVSPSGTDGAGRGTADRPYRTCDAAMTDARDAPGIDAVRFESGIYDCGAHTIREDLVIEGGFTRAGATWTAGGARSELRFATSVAAASCQTDGFNSTDATAGAALVLWPDRSMIVRDVVLQSTAGTGTCRTVVHVDGGTLRLERSEVLIDGVGSCASVIQARGVGGSRPVVEIFDATLRGSAASQTATLCVESGERVSVADSTITSTGSAAVTSFAGIAVRDVTDVTVTRSNVFAASLLVYIASGRLAALSIEGAETVVVDNSVLATPSGGTQPHVIEILDAPSSLYLYHVTAFAGRDWDNQDSRGDGIQGSVLHLAGDFASSTVALYNNVFAFASGVENDAAVTYSVLDRRAMTSDPRFFTLQGNLFSTNLQVGSPTKALYMCAGSELDDVVAEWQLNSLPDLACFSRTSPVGWSALLNRALDQPPHTTGVCLPGACTEGQYCASDMSCQPRLPRRALELSESGVVAPVQRVFVRDETGSSLRFTPHEAQVNRAVDGTLRNLSARQPAGAWRL